MRGQAEAPQVDCPQHDLPLAAARTAPGQGAEARSLHRDGGRRQAPGPRPGQVAWLLIYPDTYEIGLPNQGLQILYEILNERDDAVAERAYAPWIDLEALLRARGLPLFSVDTHRAGRRLRRARLQPLGRARLHERAELHRPRRRAGAGRATARPTDPLVDRRRALHVQPRAARRLRRRRSCIGDGEEVVGEITEVVGAWKRGGPRRSRERVLRELATIPGVYVPSMYDVDYDGARIARGHAALSPTCPRVVDKRTVADLADWPYPKHQLVPLTEVVHDRLNVEVFRGCTRGCRFCQAGMITRPVRERPGRPGAHDGRATACAAPATTRSRSRRCRRADFSRHRAASSPTSSTTRRARGQVSRVAAVAAGRRVHRRHRQPRSRRSAAPASRSRPRPARGGCARSSTS